MLSFFIFPAAVKEGQIYTSAQPQPTGCLDFDEWFPEFPPER